MTGVGCSVHPEPGGHSELWPQAVSSSLTSCPSRETHLLLQCPKQMAPQLCSEHCSPVQDGTAEGCTSSMALIEPPIGRFLPTSLMLVAVTCCAVELAFQCRVAVLDGGLRRGRQKGLLWTR